MLRWMLKHMRNISPLSPRICTVSYAIDIRKVTMGIPWNSKRHAYALVRMRAAIARHVEALEMHNMNSAGRASRWARAWAKFAAGITFQRHR